MNPFSTKHLAGRSVMAAMVLGTALTTLPTHADAAETSEISPNAVDAVSRYCQACWRNAGLPPDRWGDCTQQVFTRLLQTIDRAKWSMILGSDGEERKEFVRAIDAVKKQTQRVRKGGPLTADIPDWRISDKAHISEQRAAVAQAAESVLSPRQQRIVELSAGGWAVPEIAADLGTSVERISDEKYKAIRKLRSYFGTT